MLPQRLVPISAVILASALTLTAAAQSPQPGERPPLAHAPTAREPETSSPEQSPQGMVSPDNGADVPAPSAAAEQTPQQSTTSNEAESPQHEDARSKSVSEGTKANEDTKTAEPTTKADPDTVSSKPASNEPSDANNNTQATTGDTTSAPASSSEAATQPGTTDPDTAGNANNEAPAASPDRSAPDDASSAKAPPADAPSSDEAKTTAQDPTPAIPAAPEPEQTTATAQPPHPTLAVATGGGAFAQAYEQVVLKPFAAETGITVKDVPDEATSGDVLLLDGAELARRCAAGDLISLELSELNPTATAAPLPDDYIEGALKPCGIAAVAWSTLFVYDPAKFAKRAPRTLADVFDVRRYPGKRALPRDSRGLAEALLVADGVPPADVYAALETSDGITRLIKKLKSLGSDIIWYERLSDTITLIREGKANIAFTSNGHAFIEQARSGPLGLIWDGQVLHASYFAIPKATANQAGAKELVAFASRPEQLASLVRQIPYGPMRRSAIAGAIGMRHVVTGQDLGPFLPTAPDNMRTAIRFDPIWWKKNAARIDAALHIVNQGPPLPRRP